MNPAEELKKIADDLDSSKVVGGIEEERAKVKDKILARGRKKTEALWKEAQALVKRLKEIGGEFDPLELEWYDEEPTDDASQNAMAFAALFSDWPNVGLYWPWEEEIKLE